LTARDIPESGRKAFVTRSSASRDIYYLLAVVVGVVAIASLYFARVVLMKKEILL